MWIQCWVRTIETPIDRPAKRIHAQETTRELPSRLARIVSGGQTGVDRAALDAAMALGIPHGGWCPLGRIAEDGRIPSQYLMTEWSSREYTERTKQNVIDSDGTLVLYGAVLQGGSLLTVRCAEKLHRPCLKIRLSHPGRLDRLRNWIQEHQIQTLNIAGPRASKERDIYARAYAYLIKALS
jgi:hypothetical protein